MTKKNVENHPINESNSNPKPSKTQRKKEMHALQQLGEVLTLLNDAQLVELNLPEPLQDAIMEAKRISKFGAKHRQLQYIGKLMRKIDASDIQEKLNIMKQVSSRQTGLLHRTERWRERMLNEKHALTEFVNTYSTADIQQIRLLIRNAIKEKEADKPAENFRLLFKVLQQAILDKENSSCL
ncbi:MAG: DUF615 domain-containing protein [Nitrosomonas sp.]|nr:DUF615 domain-containing protein [Nitrosomonas sp.]